MSRLPQNEKPPCGCVKAQFGLKEPTTAEDSNQQPSSRSKSCGICKPERVRSPSKPELIPATISNVSSKAPDGEPEPIKIPSKAQSSKVAEEEELDEPEPIKSATRAQSRSRSKPKVEGSTVITDDDGSVGSVDPEPVKSSSRSKSSKPKVAGSKIVEEDIDESEEPEPIKSATRAKSRSRTKPTAAGSTVIADDDEESEEPEAIKSATRAKSRSRSKPTAAGSTVIPEDDEESEDPERIKSASRAKSRSRSKPTVAEAGESADEPMPVKSRSKAQPSAGNVPIGPSAVKISSEPEIMEEEKADGVKSCECSTKGPDKSQPTMEGSPEKGSKKAKQKRKFCECGSPDKPMKLTNPYLANMEKDILYHLALGSHSHDLEAMFGDVKFVCMGSKPKSMEKVAKYLMEETGYKVPTGTQLADISVLSYRYSMYKVGPILCVSHGMGCPSIGVLLNELIKLMNYANVKDPVFFKIGKCQGIGIEPGTVVITEEALDGMMNSYYEMKILGKSVQRQTTLNATLVQQLLSLTNEGDRFQLISGKTMCADDFYEGQANINGAFCEYTDEERIAYLNNLHRNGVVNMDMESLAFAALTNCAGFTAAIITVCILDRFQGDEVSATQDALDEFFTRPETIIGRYIKKCRESNAFTSKQRKPVEKVMAEDDLKVVYQASENFQS